jgi:predicted phage terminase large subunit-like protein
MHGTQTGLKYKGKLKRALTMEDIELHERHMAAQARQDFYAYRKFMDPTIIDGWWQQEVAEELEYFYDDWLDGLKPVLVLEAPPQHGKSRQVIDFISWASGHNPDTKAIYASYGDDLGTDANSAIQRIYADDKYHKVFDLDLLNLAGDRGRGLSSKRHSGLIEYQGHLGSFRNTTVNGQITGKGLHLGVIDDPIKGRAEASSLPVRDKTWHWFTDDFFTRFAEDAGMIMIMTRWHVDDPVGRFVALHPNARVLKYPAFGRFHKGKWVAESNTARAQALFPEHKSKEFLLLRKSTLSQASWQSLYQQSPIVVGGDMFPVEEFKFLAAAPKTEIKRSVRYWDKAGTEDGSGATTAGVLLHIMVNNTVVVEDVVRGRWGAMKREKIIRQCCELDNEERLVETWVEQEPGSGGKESAEATVRNLVGYKAYADRVTGKKEDRADPYSGQVQAGNVYLVKATWNKEFINEHEMYPNGRLKDQVDAAGGAFNKATIRKSNYDTSMSWVSGDTA